MSLKDDIYTYMQAQTVITDLVDVGSIGWVDVDLQTIYPKIIYFCISAPPLYQATDQYQRWRFFIFADSKALCRQIIDALITTFHGLQGEIGATNLGFVTKIDENPIFRGNDDIFETSIDFRFIFA